MAEAPDGRGYNAFTAELRLIQEVQRAAKDVPWLTINHLQILLTIFDMEISLHRYVFCFSATKVLPSR